MFLSAMKLNITIVNFFKIAGNFFKQNFFIRLGKEVVISWRVYHR